MTSLFAAVELDGDGAHPAAWRWSGRPPGAVLTGRALRDAVHTAESAGVALVTFADSPLPPSSGLDAAGRLEAGTRAAFVATTTRTVGLAPTLHVATTEPFHLATQLAALDHATRGRAGWVVGTANDAASAATIGAVPLDPDALARETRDVIDTARALWDSWEDDAVIRDRTSGRYLDPDRVHHVDAVGARFTVKGPLITPRPPQGQIVVLAAAELELGARADVALVGQPHRADAPLTVLDLEVVLDADRPAADRLAELDAETRWEPTGRLRHVGSVDALVALLRELDGVVDGVRFHPAVHAVDLPILQSEVLPLLRRPAGATLRESLGLPRPTNRFAGSRP
ncbi:FMNH2-utilizing oxygenase [Pseudonocardia sp. Ae717_Ps2]|uniref:LLM class flavin-dependent oxidoreductase n=1 Tax=unclassified Pseudonocardia TaxID=2619320 RepID=UPI00094ABB48|nr:MULTISPECIES: LLM class flavin-dependent oxidoreductase [unclassified Pseudonocardia]OLM14093.1 FMNH2-utilizing oxygenase [Pseudonocardia sp. Ae505_Ps2]OLM31270.1 FMNH2-utilizing oxygenase [Pseudonocardia sp. Ae717_Ps2]